MRSAFTAPAAGQWGNAARNSITGPNTFSLDGAMQRTFRPNKHFYLDARIDASNLLNHAGVHKLEHDCAEYASSDCRSRPTRCAACR